jgi:hypothetical protein
MAATPTLGAAFAQTVFKGRNVGPNGMPVTLERITRVLGGGQVEVLGAVIPVSGMGMSTLRAGSRVAVAWQQGRPVVAIAHSARRTGAPVPLPVVGGGIVEELFIAGEAGSRDVYFRNDQQVTNLELRQLLPSDPKRVRWGVGMRHFVVETGDPTLEDQAAAAEHPSGFLRTVKQYTLFRFTEGVDPLAVQGPNNSVERVGVFTPYADTSTLFQIRTTLDYQERIDKQTLLVEITSLADPTEIPAVFDDIGAGTFVIEERTLENVTVRAAEGPGSTQVDVTNPHTVSEILNGVNEGDEARLWFGDVDDFGADRDGALFLSIRATFLEIMEPTEGADTLSDSHTVIGEDDINTPPCEVTAPDLVIDSPPETVETGFNTGSPLGARTYGESHYFVLTYGTPPATPIVVWSSTGPTSLLSTTSRAAQGYNFRNQFHDWTGTHFLNLGGAAIDSSQPLVDANISDSCLGGQIEVDDEADLPASPFTEEFADAFANGIAARRMTLFNTALPFIDTPVEMTAGESTNERYFTIGVQAQWTSPTPPPNAFQLFPDIGPSDGALFVHTGFGPPLPGSSPTINEAFFYAATYTERTAVPSFIWTYRVRSLTVLDLAGPGLTPASFALVVDRVRPLTVGPPPTFEKQIGVFVLNANNELVATLLPFQTTNPGGVSNPDPFVGEDLPDDGTEATILSGNRFHVLWTLSTTVERATNIRHIKLSRITPLETVDVGSDWTEFAGHDFRVLNLDVLYAARDDDDHKLFVEAWDVETGAPTLSQTAEGYPIEDTELEPVKALADLDEDTPAAITREIQAVNDEEALSQTGRELEPEVV